MTNSSNSDFVLFNEQQQFGQTQYASRYIEGKDGRPNLGCGLRWAGDFFNYHTIRIHKDDVMRFDLRFRVYTALKELGMDDHLSNMLSKILEYGESRMSDPSHYDYLEYFYSTVCSNLCEPDVYKGNFSSSGDKMYQYRDRWERAGVPWFHGVVCYMLMDSVYPNTVRQTNAGWIDPAQWVIDNYKTGLCLYAAMIETMY